MDKITEYYQIFGLEISASPEEVKQAYRNLVKIWHPDRFMGDVQQKLKAEAEIKKINQAYDAIKSYLDSFDNPATQHKITEPHINTNKTNPKVYYEQGIKYAENQKWNEAIAEFSQAIRLNPNYLEAYQYRGFVFSKLGYENRANADLEKATKLKLSNIIKNSTYSSSEKFNKKANVSNQTKTTSSSLNSKPTGESKKQSSNLWQCVQCLMAHKNIISHIAISKNGKFFATGGNDIKVKLWQMSTHQAIKNIEIHKDVVSCFTFTPDNKFLLTASRDKTIRIWDLQEKKVVRTLGGRFLEHTAPILTLIVSRDGQTLITSDANKTIKVWDLTKGKEKYKIKELPEKITCLAISPDGNLFATASLDQQLRIRNINDGKVVYSIHNNSQTSFICFSPDGKLLATGGFARAVKIWNLTNKTELITLNGHRDRIGKLIFSPDGKTLISSSHDKVIKLWQLETQKEICTLLGHADQVSSIGISPDGQTIISGDNLGILRIWKYIIHRHKGSNQSPVSSEQ
jgi:WD40 repeat protein